jgi:monooxygenase
MFTLSYPFRPWVGERAIADGGSILHYLRSTAEDFGVDRRIRDHHRVTRAEWSSESSRWTVEAIVGEDHETVRFGANFHYLCSAYYRHNHGYPPDFPGLDIFTGEVVHPQHRPEGLSYQDQRVVIIGSGAKAVALAPALASAASQVTMLQRSPSYLISLPSVDPRAEKLPRILPAPAAHRVLRWKNLPLGTAFYRLCRHCPGTAAGLMRAGVARQLPEGYRLDPDFRPRYKPWDQRLCVTPDGDLFNAIRSGRLAVVTDRIDTFISEGIRLAPGRRLAADLVVAATGLELCPAAASV